MEVILLKKVENLGSLGDIVKVKSGYGRNYLVPTGRAKMATKENLVQFEQRRAELEAEAQQLLVAAEARREQLQELVLTLKARTGGEGKLFGSISSIEIADAIKEAGIEIERREIRMPNGPLRMLGEHSVMVHLHTDVDTSITVIVEAEKD